MNQSETLIVEITLAARDSFRFQILLEGEDGLGVVRCFDPEHKKQQIWTTPAQKQQLFDWLDTLPTDIQYRVSDQWLWREKN